MILNIDWSKWKLIGKLLSRTKKIYLTTGAESIYTGFRGYITFHCDEPFRYKQLNKFELDSLHCKWFVNCIITLTINI